MILELKNISKTYPSGRRALQSISFKIEEGEILAIIGLSGAGKSTMLRCINRLVEPDEGEVIFLGEKINKLKGKKLRQYRSKIGMIFQNYNLVERLNAVENVLHGCLGSIPSYRGALGLYTEEEKEKAFALLQTVGMEEFAFQRCSELSGGQKQRIGIARALMQNPKLLLCDEPIASLDPQSAETVLNYIKEFAVNKNIACLISLHQMEAAKKYADRIIALNNGKIVFDGKPDSLNDEVLHKEIFTSVSMDSGEKNSMKFDLKIYSEDNKKKRHYHKKETSYSWEKRQIFFAKKKLKAIIILLSLILIYYFASNITGFKDLKAIFKFPLAIAWLIKNFIPDNESLKHIPIIIKTLGETCVIAASATTAAAFFALILALLGSQTTGINKPFKIILTMTASFLRNIPLVAWAMLLLFSFKQNNFTGFLALFIITLGHLVRVFKEMIEETSEESFTALRAAGVPYFPALFNAVFPSIAPGLVSWLLYTVETNVRDSALIGILTGTGIGFLFNLYFKSFRYNSAGLIILCLVIIVLLIDILSNKIRRILL